MSKKDIMKREIKAMFNKQERQLIEADVSPISQRSNMIMRICRGATLFVIVMSPILNIISFDAGSLSGFMTGLVYTLFIFFVLTPLLYLLLSAIFLRAE